MIQFFIAITGMAQIWLLSEKSENRRKLALPVMILSNVFWSIETVNKELWGMLFLNLWYWACSFKMLYLYYVKE